MPKKKGQYTAFYHNLKAFHYNFNGEAVSSDGGVLLLSKLERKHKLIKEFSEHIPDYRNPVFVSHTYEKQLQQRVFMMAMGYEDCNDSKHLKDDPILNVLLENGLCSQPTLCRMENNIDSTTLWKLSEWFLDRYVNSIDSESKEIVIDVDTTDDPTHGNQQLSLFHGYYWQWMYQELFFLDGKTGQMILPALLSGTEHPSKRFTSLLKRIVKKIRKCFPSIRIIIRADAGFSCSEFYQLADEYDLKYCIGLSSNSVLKQLLDPEIQWVRENYLKKGLKYQHIVGAYGYKAKSWEHFQKVYAKVESTGKGMNTRIFVSNLEDQTGEQIYYDFYTHRGETCENRIKEIKNMCYSDRLSCHRFSANYFRLMLSALVYEFFRLIKKLIARTKYDQAKKWLVNNIRLFILKVGAIVSERKRYINIKFSKAYARQNLFRQLIELS